MLSAACFEPEVEECVLPTRLLIMMHVKRTTYIYIYIYIYYVYCVEWVVFVY
jgi:hypothetical protein